MFIHIKALCSCFSPTSLFAHRERHLITSKTHAFRNDVQIISIKRNRRYHLYPLHVNALGNVYPYRSLMLLVFAYITPCTPRRASQCQLSTHHSKNMFGIIRKVWVIRIIFASSVLMRLKDFLISAADEPCFRLHHPSLIKNIKSALTSIPLTNAHNIDHPNHIYSYQSNVTDTDPCFRNMKTNHI